MKDLARLEAANRARNAHAGLDAVLTHSGGWPALSITGSPQSLDLTLSNRTPHPIWTDYATISLAFRPGILRDVDRIVIAPQSEASWGLTIGPGDDEGSLRLDFASAHSAEIAPGGALVIRIDGVSAAEAGGSRATRVGMRYAGFVHEDGTEIDGGHVLHLPVLRRHEPHFLPMRQVRGGSAARAGPFVAGFVGGGALLNDGRTPNPLTVRVMNVSGRPLGLNDGGDDATRFHLGWQMGAADAEWGLLSSEGDHLSVSLSGAADERPMLDAGANWQVDHHTVRRVGSGDLPPGGYVDFDLVVHTKAEPGTAQLVLSFENVAGHDDGDLVLLAALGPVAVARDAEGHETLRITQPLDLHAEAARLRFHTAEPFQTDTARTASIGINRTAAHLGRLEISAPSGLHIDGDVLLRKLHASSVDADTVQAGTVWTDAARADGLYLNGENLIKPLLAITKTTSTSRLWRSRSAVTGPAVSLQGYNGSSNSDYTPLLLNPSGGPVGVNTSRPSSALHVEGEIISQFVSAWGIELASRFASGAGQPGWNFEFLDDSYTLVLHDHLRRGRIYFYDDGTAYIARLRTSPR